MTIIPDDKDWTWVLERPCPECGFDASSVPATQVAPLIRANAREWVAILSGDPTTLRTRPREDRWSPLEYACHVRDVFRLFDERLRLMLTRDNPTFANWDQDRTSVEGDYNAQDPVAVSTDLEGAATALAATFETVDAAGWNRRGSRSDGARFTVETFGRYLIHDPVHHLRDVRGDLGPEAPRP